MAFELHPKSALAFVLAASLVALFFGVASNDSDLAAVAWPFLIISGVIWLIFVALSMARNLGSMR